MVIRGEVQIDVFTFSFTIHGSRGDWKLTISAPGFPFGSVTTEQETKEPTWYSGYLMECSAMRTRLLVAADFQGVRSPRR